jgi:Aspartyl protease
MRGVSPLFSLLLVGALAAACMSVAPAGPSAAPDPAAARSHFEQAHFGEAVRACAPDPAPPQSAPDCALLLAQIALLEDRVEVAVDRASEALRLGADAGAARQVLLEAHYRRREFGAAAQHARALGRAAFADKLESFGADPPYLIDAPTGTARLAFQRTDPLPLVRLVVDGRAGHFIIDTGASELVLDPAFAAEIGARDFGAEQGVFAAGRRAPARHARVGAVQIGAQTLRNVPALVLDTSRFSPAAGGLRVDGVLGTSVFYRFLVTLDYVGGELVLAPREGARDSGQANRVQPMWLAGSHFILARGQLNDAAPALMFIDTGLAGPAFAAPRAALAAAGIEGEGASFTGIAGAGPIRVMPIRARRLALGQTGWSDQVGVAGAFPESLAQRFGFPIGGLFSHALFRGHGLTLDFARMQLVLTPATP